jgi:hypothetical protein
MSPRAHSLARLARVAAWAACGAMASLTPRAADASCRSRTVSQRSTLPGCQLADATRDCQTCGKPLYWPTRCVGYSIEVTQVRSLAGDDVKKLVDDAFARWTSVTCAGAAGRVENVSIDARDLGPVDCREGFQVGKPSHNPVMFQDRAWPYAAATTGGIAIDSDTLALTTLRFDKDTGEIFGGTIELNAAQHRFEIAPAGGSDAYDLERVLTHEVGHFLGLAHSDDPTSVMYWSASPGRSRSELSQDDIRAICDIYRAGGTRSVDPSVAKSGFVEARPCDPRPAEGFTATCAPDATALALCAAPRAPRGVGSRGAWVALALAIGARACRRRNRSSAGPAEPRT